MSKGDFVSVDWSVVEQLGPEYMDPVIPGPLTLLQVYKVSEQVAYGGLPWVMVRLVSYTELFLWLPGVVLVHSKAGESK